MTVVLRRKGNLEADVRREMRPYRGRDGCLQARERPGAARSLPAPSGAKPASTAICLFTIHARLLESTRGRCTVPSQCSAWRVSFIPMSLAGIFFGISLIALTQRQNSPTEVCRVRPCRISVSTMFSGLGHSRVRKPDCHYQRDCPS